MKKKEILGRLEKEMDENFEYQVEFIFYEGSKISSVELSKINKPK